MSQRDLPDPEKVDELLRLLAVLRVVAPTSTVERLRRRMQTLQLGRDLFEKQVYGFWIVLHSLLVVAFRYFTGIQRPGVRRRI